MRFKFLPSGEKKQVDLEGVWIAAIMEKKSAAAEGVWGGKGAWGSDAQQCSAPQRAKPPKGR